ncbi:MFS transporter, partial [Bacillus thuringiensis]|nr:MFS transporter [Bacillus thuringiensis]
MSTRTDARESDQHDPARQGEARIHPARYAIGMFGTSIPINLIRGSIILFYVDILGMDVRAYAIVMALYAVIDAIDNPLLGHLSDRTRSRHGRRRPWLLIGAPLLAACTIALFSPPSVLDGMA